MPQVRLLGLVLFITAIFLAMAAAATQTTHIRFKQPAGVVDGGGTAGWQTPPLRPSDPQPPAAPVDSVLPPPAAEGPPLVADGPLDPGLQFTAVPVVYPLVMAGGLGLLMWFVPAAFAPRKPQRKRRRRRR